MLLLLGIMTQVLPQILKGNDPHEMIGTMMQIIVGFALIGGLIVLIGLIVWLKVRNGNKR